MSPGHDFDDKNRRSLFDPVETEDELLSFDVDEDEDDEERQYWSGVKNPLEEDWELFSREVKKISSPPKTSSILIKPGLHEVQQGECISDIAYRAGLLPATIWKHSSNAKLKERRQDQYVLMPGDQVYIPDKRHREEQGQTNKRRRFRRKGVPEKFRIQLLEQGLPLDNANYIMEINGRLVSGKTDVKGWLKQPIFPNDQTARLIVNPGTAEEYEYEVVLGGIDPKDVVTGWQQRLINLGYDCQLSGELDDQTKSALAFFQEDYGLEMTGEPDSDTQLKLEKGVTKDDKKEENNEDD